MKNRKIAFNIISIISNLLLGIIFLIPVWYFSKTTTINETENESITNTINLLEFESMKSLRNDYASYNEKLNTTFYIIFLTLFLFTLIISLFYIVLTTLNIIKKLPTYKKLSQTCRVSSITILVLGILTLISSLIFSIQSKKIVVHTEDVSVSLSINISTGIYLYTIFTLAAGFTGYNANRKTKYDEN